MSIIEFNSVNKSYKDPSIRHIFKPKISRGVKDLSFKIEEKETFGIVGLNGAGKTTTLKLLLGLLKPDSGSILLFGKFYYKNLLARVGYLPEISYFHKNLTAYETIYFLAKLSGYKAAASEIKDALQKVGLDNPELDSGKISTFSKGQMQRLGVAQSLIHNPDILIYDEPTSGLDPLGIKEMRQLIAELKNSGKTIILSSHLISEVERLCDRVGIIKDGTLVNIISAPEFSKPGQLEKIFVETVV